MHTFYWFFNFLFTHPCYWGRQDESARRFHVSCLASRYSSTKATRASIAILARINRTDLTETFPINDWNYEMDDDWTMKWWITIMGYRPRWENSKSIRWRWRDNLWMERDMESGTFFRKKVFLSFSISMSSLLADYWNW